MTNNLSRVTAKIFAGNAPLDTIGQFGSALAGTKVNTQDVSQLQALPAYENGWSQAVISDKNYPTLEEMNGAMKVMSYQMAYTMQKGLCEWDTDTVYFANISFCQVNGVWYQSLINYNIGNNPTTSPNAWKELPLTNIANQNLSNLTSVGEAHFANPSLSNLNSTGQNILDSKLNISQITNCILKAPKITNLTLSNGALTLNSGSRAIVPYGTSAPTMSIGQTLNGHKIVDISWDNSKLFYIIETQFNIQYTAYGTSKRFCFVSGAGGSDSMPLHSTYSSNTQPTGFSTYATWYDTANNIVKHTNDNGASWVNYYSLPIAIATDSNSDWSSIDETFQSIGCIGNTVWVNKGVKVLIPNGKNADGTLNNIEHTTPSVRTLNNLNGTPYLQLNEYGLSSVSSDRYKIVDSLPSNTTLSGWSIYYNNSDNYMWLGNSTQAWSIQKSMILGLVNVQNGAITEFKPKQAFRAVDFNDYIDTVNSIIPARQINYSAGITTTFPANTLYSYTAPKDGIITISGVVNNAYSWVTINEVEVALLGDNSQAASVVNVTLPVSRGDVVAWTSPQESSTCKFFPYKGDL